MSENMMVHGRQKCWFNQLGNAMGVKAVRDVPKLAQSFLVYERDDIGGLVGDTADLRGEGMAYLRPDRNSNS